MPTPLTKELFRDDSYLKHVDCRVIAHQEGGVILDQTPFYVHGGGQAGDQGALRWDGGSCRIHNTIKDRDTNTTLHLVEGDTFPPIGSALSATIDWELRYARMKMHSTLHLLCAIIPFGVTGGQINENKSRLDFDVTGIESPLNADNINGKLLSLIAENHAITSRWVDDALLQQQPDIVRTMSVAPPKNADGLLRLVQIGDDSAIVDLQPCGGTHVARTKEIGAIKVAKIENKGARNRRISVVFD